MQPVERAEYEGVDYGWVMQTTFVVTILVGAPIVAALSAFYTLESWPARAAFAVRVGAPIWFVTAVAVAVYAGRTDAGDGGVADTDDDGDADNDSDANDDCASSGDVDADTEDRSSSETAAGSESADEDAFRDP